jgi:hypothetical protein
MLENQILEMLGNSVARLIKLEITVQSQDSMPVKSQSKILESNRR